MARSPAYTPGFVEAGYNNRAAVPDHPAWFARFAAESARARAALQPREDLRYGPNPKETLDLFLPSGPAKGTLVFIHGGYWRALDKADHSFVAPAFVAQGLAVAVVNYDLCPAVRVADIVDECRRALRWLVREGERYGVATERLVVAGHSCGGHLAAMMLATDAAAMGLGRHPVTGAASVSGVHDLRPMVQFSYNADLRLDEAEAVRLSPIDHEPATDAAILAVAGADETSEFIRQAQLLWDAWPGNRPAGAAGPLIVPGRHHFSVLMDYADAGSGLTRATLALF